MALQAPVVSSPSATSNGHAPAHKPAKRPRVSRASRAATKAIHGGQEPCPVTGAILTPIYQTTTFVQEGVGGTGYSYSRCSNPTVTALEKALGTLEDAPPAVTYSTGIGAVAGLFFALLKSGDHVVVGDVIYGGTTRLLQQILQPLGVRATWVDTSNPAAVAKAIEPGVTKLVLIETPGNPTLKLTDVAAIAKVTKAAGVPLAVDNTFFTAALLRPLDLGADISVYSTTKYIEGHNGTIGGAVITNDEALLERLRFVRKSLGGIQTPLEAWLTLRGLKTLPLRIEQHCRAAQQIAEWLEHHPAVSRVLYPGLKSFPQAELAQRLHARGLHGGIISFELHGGTDAALTFVKNISLCSLAESLGAVETLVTHSATMTHADVPRAQREAAGITDGLVRLSVGLEDPDDIIADLREALDSVL